ncbi:MAG: transposase [Nitrospirae bacterium YQR-1]
MERRRYDKEFKAEAVRLVVEGGRKVSDFGML